jgi:hypothetical protein
VNATVVIEQGKQVSHRTARALRSGSSAHPGAQSARPLFQSCFPLRGKSTPVFVSHEAEPEWPEPAEHTRQEHPDHDNDRSCRNEVGCCRRRCPRENRPSGINSSGKKRTWPPLTTNTITAIARPIASTRINGPPVTVAFPGQRGSRPPKKRRPACTCSPLLRFALPHLAPPGACFFAAVFDQLLEPLEIAAHLTLDDA